MTFLAWLTASWVLPLGAAAGHEDVVEAGGALAAVAAHRTMGGAGRTARVRNTRAQPARCRAQSRGVQRAASWRST